MTPQTQALFDAALALPEDQRALLAERLLETLDEDDEEWEEVTEEEFLAELERRRAEMENGTDPGIPWSELAQEE